MNYDAIIDSPLELALVLIGAVCVLAIIFHVLGRLFEEDPEETYVRHAREQYRNWLRGGGEMYPPMGGPVWPTQIGGGFPMIPQRPPERRGGIVWAIVALLIIVFALLTNNKDKIGEWANDSETNKGQIKGGHKSQKNITHPSSNADIDRIIEGDKISPKFVNDRPSTVNPPRSREESGTWAVLLSNFDTENQAIKARNDILNDCSAYIKQNRVGNYSLYLPAKDEDAASRLARSLQKLYLDERLPQRPHIVEMSTL